MARSCPFGSVGGEPAWLGTVVAYLPLAPIIDGSSHALFPRDGGPALSAHGTAVLVAWAAVGMVLSLRWFRWTPRS